MAMEDLGSLGLYKGIKLGTIKTITSHIFYADDALFLGEWSRRNIENLVGVLNCFYLASGLKLNLAKSNLFGVGVPSEDVQVLASLIGFKAENFPIIYLALPVGDNMARVKGWDRLLDKFRKKLSNWKVKTLTIGGMSMLLKTIL